MIYWKKLKYSPVLAGRSRYWSIQRHVIQLTICLFRFKFILVWMWLIWII